MSYSRAGCENPATAATSPVIVHRAVRPGVQMPGSRTRKIPGPAKAGQDTAGEARQVKITHSGKSPGKQTWKGAADGYTTRSAPAYVAAEVGGNASGSGGGAKQHVKGKHPAKVGGEAKSVAGKS
mgnify:FL=1